MNQIHEKEIDDALCSIYDIHDADDYYVQMILKYCHDHKKEIAEWIKERR